MDGSKKESRNGNVVVGEGNLNVSDDQNKRRINSDGTDGARKKRLNTGIKSKRRGNDVIGKTEKLNAKAEGVSGPAMQQQETVDESNITPNAKVVYFHDPEISVFEHGLDHCFRPFRANLAHSLICCLDYYPACLTMVQPRLVNHSDLGQFHSDAYLEVLSAAQTTVGKPFSWSGMKHFEHEGFTRTLINGATGVDVVGGREHSKAKSQTDETDTTKTKFHALFSRFGLYFTKEVSSRNVFPGILDHCRMVTTGTLGCVEQLCSKEAGIAINWYGGMSHARSSSAHYGCYINDTVLGILRLLHTFTKVMYINLSGVHCDAVEQAFYTTPRVLTISFHSELEFVAENRYVGTGNIEDCGTEDGLGFSINVPVQAGIGDSDFTPLFKDIVMKARSVYSPECIVLQLGSALLADEMESVCNMSSAGYADCVRLCRDFRLPLLLLGGVGRNLASAARLWAHATCVALNKESSFPKTLPVDMEDHREYFGPTYETVPPTPTLPENLCDPKILETLHGKIMKNLDDLRSKLES